MITIIRGPFPMAAYALILGLLLLSAGCSRSDVAANNAVANKAAIRPANIEVKPVETEAIPLEPKSAGKEIKPADGPALKSVIPPEGAVLGGLLNDLAVSLPKPEYPADAKGAKGTVTVEVLVNEKGVVTTSSVVGGPQSLWSAAGAAARQAKFDPPLKDGKPVKVAGVLTYDFEN